MAMNSCLMNLNIASNPIFRCIAKRAQVRDSLKYQYHLGRIKSNNQLALPEATATLLSIH